MARRAIETEDDGPTLHPKYSEHLVAHAAAERELLAQIHAGKLPHALLLTGPKGVGKATLGYRLARHLLQPLPEEDGLFGPPPAPTSFQMRPDHSIFRRIALGAHPDFLALEGMDIKIDETRSIAHFLSLTPAESLWRIVLIDSIDALNRNAANALLKTLEEPPARAVLILISHNPGMLLPTIRSRCRLVRMAPLKASEFSRIMAEKSPDMQVDDYPLWSTLSGGSAGVAMALSASKADALYRELLGHLTQPDLLRLHGFAERFARKELQGDWLNLLRLAPWLLGRIAAVAGGLGVAELFAGEEAMLAGLAARKPLDLWAELWEKTHSLLSDADRLHLDRKQTVLTFMRSLSESP